ncbi:MAG: radical SAM protein [Deltaproteobacteria bacterium]|nr:radical SAM protein [Deltaproteobacteria bacterium]
MQFTKKYGFSPPFTILISPTMQCNLKCVGCYSGRYTREKGLSSELIDRVVTEAEEMGIRFIVFSGGEPLIRKTDLFPLIEKHADTYFMFYTNGTLIDDGVADELYRLGNAGAIISLEGFEQATNARRGKGVYRQVMDAMDRLKMRGVPFGTSLTVTSKNLEELTSDEFFQQLYNKGVMVVWFFLFMPVGKDPDVSLMPSPEQRDSLRRRGSGLRDRFPIFIADFWNDAPYVGGCIAGGTNYVHINSNGDVEPCVFTHVAVDSIVNKSLADCLGSEFFTTIRSKQPYSDNLLTPCMIIDNPDVFREVVRKCRAYPTHDGADDVLTKIRDELDDYGRRVRALYDPIWEREKTEYGCEGAREFAAGTHSCHTR